MDWDRYLELLETDGSLLASTARSGDLAAPIPTCPGWTVRDAVAHTGAVYQHKIACMRLQRSPGDDYEQEPPAGTDLLDWYDASLAALLTELRQRGPDAPAYTWWPPDQTVGFWYRRMAQEAAVHRVDVQDAFGAATPIDEELAVDGIDEVLDRFLSGDWSDEPPEEWRGVDPAAGAGEAIAVRTQDRVWRTTLAPDIIALARDDGPASRVGHRRTRVAAAVVVGTPSRRHRRAGRGSRCHTCLSRSPPPGDSVTMTRLVLIRHGEAQSAIDGVVGGPLGCTGLSELGRRQADALAARLVRTGELAGAVALYASTLPRAIETSRADSARARGS